MKDKGMEYMTGYGNASGYSPPKGSAGKAAFGNYSTKGNPMSVPRKGSSITSGEPYGGRNPDVMKMHSQIKAQAMKENLRGQSGC